MIPRYIQKLLRTGLMLNQHIVFYFCNLPLLGTEGIPGQHTFKSIIFLFSKRWDMDSFIPWRVKKKYHLGYTSSCEEWCVLLSNLVCKGIWWLIINLLSLVMVRRPWLCDWHLPVCRFSCAFLASQTVVLRKL